jgi:hypothetical protein
MGGKRREQVSAAASEVDDTGAFGKSERICCGNEGIDERAPDSGAPETAAGGNGVG